MFDNVVKTGRLRNSAKEPTITDVEAATSAHHPRPTLFRSASCSCGGGCPSCQSKSNVNISYPNDPAEIEADQIADRVMRMPAGNVVPTAKEGQPNTMQRKALGPSASATSSSAIFGSSGAGLDAATRRFFEPRFGQDLGHVRIHTSPADARTANDISARAFTLGSDIGFAAGSYEPTSHKGRRLIAHELAHVVQKSTSSPDEKNQAISRSVDETADVASLEESNEMYQSTGDYSQPPRPNRDRTDCVDLTTPDKYDFGGGVFSMVTLDDEICMEEGKNRIQIRGKWWWNKVKNFSTPVADRKVTIIWKWTGGQEEKEVTVKSQDVAGKSSIVQTVTLEPHPEMGDNDVVEITVMVNRPEIDKRLMGSGTIQKVK